MVENEISQKRYINTVCPKTGKPCEDTGCNFVDCASPDGYWSDNEFVEKIDSTLLNKEKRINK